MVANPYTENWHAQVQKSIDLNAEFNCTWPNLDWVVRYRNKFTSCHISLITESKEINQFCSIK